MLDFLAYLEFERGLSRNTLEAYRSDLLQLGAYLERVGGRRAGGRPRRPRRLPRRAGGRWRWTARRSRPRRCSARRRACAPSTATCAARRSSRTTRPPTCARRARASGCPRCSAATRSTALLARAAGHRPRRAARPRAAGAHVRLRPARHRGDRPGASRDVDLRHGVLRARGKGSKERLVPVGREAVAAVRAYLERGRPAARRPARRAAPVRQPPRHGPHPPGPLQDRPAPRARRRAGGPDEPAHAAPHLRDAPAGRRLRPALGAGDARPRRHRHDADLHAPQRRAPEGRVLQGPPARDAAGRLAATAW